MKNEDRLELFIAIISGVLALGSLTIIKSVPIPITAGVFSLGATGCFFFALSFSQRHHRNKDV